MMKLVNRLLIIAVIAFGAWFIIQHWDSVETPTEIENTEEIAFEGEKGEDLMIDIDIDSPLSFDEQLKALEEEKVVSENTTTVKPVRKYVSSTTRQKTTETVFQEDSEVTVYLFDGGIDLSTSVVPTGNITFTVRNDGRVSHDFSVEGIKDFGRIVPGSIHTFEINLVEGEYVLTSPRELDQQLEMRETLRVENAQ